MLNWPEPGRGKVTGVLLLAKSHLLTSPTNELLLQNVCPPQQKVSSEWSCS